MPFISVYYFECEILSVIVLYNSDKVQDKSRFPDRALLHFAHEIIFIIAVICY